MNRRELMQQVLGSLVVGGVSVSEITVVDASQRPAVVILELPTACTEDQLKVLRAGFDEKYTRGTVLEGTKFLVVTGGARLTVFDRMGGVCQQQVDDWLRT